MRKRSGQPVLVIIGALLVLGLPVLLLASRFFLIPLPGIGFEQTETNEPET